MTEPWDRPTCLLQGLAREVVVAAQPGERLCSGCHHDRSVCGGDPRTPCDQLIMFADGELDGAEAQAFRVHLTSCKACEVDLVEHLHLTAILSAADPGGDDGSR